MPDRSPPSGDLETALAALAAAAGSASRYRRWVASAERTPTASHAEMMAGFDHPVPERGLAADEVIAELTDRATPGLRASTAPRFFGWVIGNSHPVGVAADWLASAWGQNAGNVLGAPAAAAVEAVAVRWLLDLLDLPREASVGVVTGATVANFVCLAAARSEVLRRVGWDVEADGLIGAPPITVLIGEDAHATVYAALKYLGLGARRARRVATDDLGRMLPSAFEAALKLAEGPIIAIGQAGQINTGASDPFATLAPLARQAGAWFHVDGAFGLWARACPPRAHLVAGVEQADSWATDGHKWLQTPYDTGFAIVRDADAHRRAMAVSASYLPPAADEERDPSSYVPELSRRARGFAVWAMIRHLGREGIASMVESCCVVAREIAMRLAVEPGVTILAPVELNQALVQFGEGEDADRLTLETIDQIQRDGIAFAGSSRWRGRWAMRVSVSSIATTSEQGRIAADAFIAAWRTVRARGGVADAA